MWLTNRYQDKTQWGNSYREKSVSNLKTGSQLWNAQTMRWILIVHGKTIKMNINISAKEIPRNKPNCSG
jgi:hypothetical protein